MVDGTALVGRLDHERLRAWLASNAETDIAAELSRLRLATLAILHDLANALAAVGLDKRNEPDTREALLQAIELVALLRLLHRGESIAAIRLDIGEVVARLARESALQVFTAPFT